MDNRTGNQQIKRQRAFNTQPAKTKVGGAAVMATLDEVQPIGSHQNQDLFLRARGQ
jgi:hypothetical protein